MEIIVAVAAVMLAAILKTALIKKQGRRLGLKKQDKRLRKSR